jgi:thioredoxin-dependent peroxiredoxin
MLPAVRARQRLLVLICLAVSASMASAIGELKVGAAAPDFSLQGSDGKTYRLSDYKGKQAVVLAWFTKAFSAP